MVRSMDASSLARMVGALDDQPGPAYARLAAAIRLLVLDGRLALEVRLPGERDLAGALDVSRTTVTSAYDALRAGGFASSRRGSGTWTTLPDSRMAPAALAPWAPDSSSAAIDLAHASPEAPAQALRAAYDHALTALPHHLPGHGYDLIGLDGLRESIARRFTARGLPTTPEQILVTAGAQHAFSLLLSLLVDAGDRVLVEHPTYPNALDAIRRVDARAVPVALGESGWDVEAFAAAARQTAPRLAYLVPDFHNPTGLVASADERRGLAAAFARSHTTMVIDETLSELWFEAAPPPFAALSPEAVTIGSASKTFWGGLRIGWIRADRALIRRLAAVRASVDNASPVLEQLAVTYLLDHHDDVLPGRRRELRDRRDALVAAVSAQLPEWTVRRPDGGLVLWCDIAEPVSSRMAVSADRYGLRLGAGPRFGVDGAFERRLRLPYTHPAEVLERAVEQVAQVYRASLDGLGTAAEGPLDVFS